MNPSICLFSYVCPIPVYDEPREDRRVSGQPRRTTWNHYDSDDGVVSAGVWACETGRWRIAFAADKEEFFAVLEGRVRLWVDRSFSITGAGTVVTGTLSAGMLRRGDEFL